MYKKLLQHEDLESRRCITEETSFYFQITIATWIPLLKESRSLVCTCQGKNFDKDSARVGSHLNSCLKIDFVALIVKANAPGKLLSYFTKGPL